MAELVIPEWCKLLLWWLLWLLWLLLLLIIYATVYQLYYCFSKKVLDELMCLVIYTRLVLLYKNVSIHQPPDKRISIFSNFIISQDKSPARKLAGVTFPPSLWLVVHCICLLTSWFIYWCLAWNHGWHGIPWCKRKQVNIPVSLPAAAAPETWISAVNATQASCWWERTDTVNTEY